jgi:hypothetical protein
VRGDGEEQGGNQQNETQGRLSGTNGGGPRKRKSRVRASGMALRKLVIYRLPR